MTNKNATSSQNESSLINIESYEQDLLSNIDLQIKEIDLPDEEELKIISNTGIQKSTNIILSLMPGIGPVAKSIAEYEKDINSKIRHRKLEALLARTMIKVENQVYFAEQFKKLLANPRGYMLFSKIQTIVDSQPYDEELIDQLSSSLGYILSHDFESLFEQDKFALDTISKLSPQALAILADHKSWPKSYKYKQSQMMYTEDDVGMWGQSFAGAYADQKGITDTNLRLRILSTIDELISGRYLRRVTHSDEGDKYGTDLSQRGREIIPYIQYKKV